jgi:GT2 family glycosyltransferase
MTQPKILIVLILYEGEQWIRNCIQSVVNNKYDNSEIFLIDNSSKDQTMSIVKRYFPHIRVCVLPKNVGFARAANIGIDYATLHKFDYVFLLNQDVKLAPNCINYLVKACLKRPNIGIASPFQMTYNGLSIDPAFERLVHSNTFMQNNLEITSIPQKTLEVDTVIGAALFFPTRLFQIIGTFDPVFFLYHEEGDLCRRARYHGYEIHVIPRAKIFHWHTQLNPSEMSLRAKWSSLYGYYLYILKDPFRSSTENFYLVVKQIVVSIFRDKRIAKIMKRFFINSFAFLCVMYRIPRLLNRRSQEMKRGIAS